MARSPIAIARRALALKAVERYKKDPYQMMRECFMSKNPKGKEGERIAPWFDSEYHEHLGRMILTRTCDGDIIDKITVEKSKQTYVSHLAAGCATAQMILQRGFQAYAQSRKDEMSNELLNDRVAFILRNLRGPLSGAVEEGEDWGISANVLTIYKFLDEPRESKFTAFPLGPDQWRGPAGSLGILDELAYHQHGLKTQEAAASMCEGGGLLLIISTHKYGSHFTKECDLEYERYVRWYNQNHPLMEAV